MPGPFEEGPVSIAFELSNRRQKVTFVIDFGLTQIDPLSASVLVRDIVQLLRERLNVKLPDFRD